MIVKVAFLGPVGTFSWQAALLYNSEAELVECKKNSDVIKAILSGEADCGVIARENSIGGTVVDAVEPIIASSVGISLIKEGEQIVYSNGKLMLAGNLNLPIKHCLFAKKDSPQWEEGVLIYSHEQALAQCSNYLQKYFPGADLVSTVSTVAAIPKMLESLEPALAIAPEKTGELYPEVVMIEEGIENDHTNTTRFVVVSNHDCKPTGNDKTSILFGVPQDERPGSFDRVSQLFACCGINKSLIESRPAKTALGRYVFLMDLDGHRQDSVLRRIFELIVEVGLTTTLRIFGSYPRQ